MADAAKDTDGYGRLLWVDPSTGRYNGSETILVPLLLAQVLNAARLKLYDRRVRTSAWQRAGVTRIAVERDDDPCGEDDAAAPRPVPQAPAVAAAPPKAAVSPPARVLPTRLRIRSGHLVPVFDPAAIAQRAKEATQRLKFSSEEKKAEVRLMEDLVARGPLRRVGFDPRWRQQLAELRERMPNFSAVIARIEAACALAQFTRTPLRIPPLLLAGPPGVGKSHFALQLASVLGVPQFVHALESAETVSTLAGSDKHWWQSEPGQLWRLIVQGDAANPVVVLDELDKANAGQYRPANALHAVLEPATARRLRDKSMDLCFDASYVVYVATCNRLSRVDATLRSRFEIFLIDEPGPRGAVGIARAIGRQLLDELKLGRRFEAPCGEVVQQLALLGGPRQMHKLLRAAIGRAVLAGRTRVGVADLLDGGGPRVSGARDGLH